MSPKTPILKDRFGRAYQPGARIIYPTRRGSFMALVEATVIGTGQKREYSWSDPMNVVFATREGTGTKVTLKNLTDVVVIPAEA